MSDSYEDGTRLFRWEDGSYFHAYVRRFDDYGNRVDGEPDSRSFAMPKGNRVPIGGHSEKWNAETLLDVAREADTRNVRHMNRCVRAYNEDVAAIRNRKRNERNAERAEAEAFVPLHPLVELRRDVKEGRVPRSSQVVTETVRVREGNRNVYDTFTLEASGLRVQIERLTRDVESRTRVLESAMRTVKGGTQGNPKVTVAGKGTRGTRNAYLTGSHLQRIADEAIGGDVRIVTENAKGIQCVRYFRNRHSRVLGIVRRHLREAEEGNA